MTLSGIWLKLGTFFNVDIIFIANMRKEIISEIALFGKNLPAPPSAG
jgi:hypothetical protein